MTLTCSAVRPKRLTPLTWAPAPRRAPTWPPSPFAAAAVSSSSIVQNVRPPGCSRRYRRGWGGWGWGVD